MTQRSRKWQLTINNPLDYDYTHEKINEIMTATNFIYYCMCDEIGENGTPHTHIYVCYENAVMFDTMKKRFSEAHLEPTRGSSQENRDYIRKEGDKYTEKRETNIIETFEEYGEMPLDKRMTNESVSAQVLGMIEEGASNLEIIIAFPSYMTKQSALDQTRQLFLEQKLKGTFRPIETTYIYGETGTGKTSSIFNRFPAGEIFRVTNYANPFDTYRGQSILVLDEFRSPLPFSEFLNILDGYYCLLKSRYSDKVACYEKVIIISNIPLHEQYPNIQIEQPASWEALLRRINHIERYERNTGDYPFTEMDEVAITIEK